MVSPEPAGVRIRVDPRPLSASPAAGCRNPQTKWELSSGIADTEPEVETKCCALEVVIALVFGGRRRLMSLMPDSNAGELELRRVWSLAGD